MKFLVIPSNRPENLHEFFDAWRGKGGWDRVIIVEDAPTKSRSESIAAADSMTGHHYAWNDIDRILGDDAWIISREDSAIRSFGFLAAYHLGATSVLTLDDDCFPESQDSKGNIRQWLEHGQYDLFATHLLQMDRHNVWVPSVPNQRTRGIPYKNLGRLDNVKVNVGLWTNIGDWDSLQERPAGWYEPPLGSRIIPSGQLTALCGMNLAFKREAIPLMYFPLQGKGWPYRRFDDIWCGVIAKTLMDRLGWSMSVGEPFVEHRRASDPEVNRVKEAPGLEANEWFWQEVQEAGRGIPCDDEIGVSVTSPVMMSILGNLMRDSDRDYIRSVGHAMELWSKLFNKKLEF